MSGGKSGTRQRRVFKFCGRLLVLFVAAYLLLLIPGRDAPTPVGAGKTPFAWNQDSRWADLEQSFLNARTSGCETVSSRFQSQFTEVENRLLQLQWLALGPSADEFDQLETGLFVLAPLAAACPERANDYVTLANRARSVVKEQSQRWDFKAPLVHARMYRLLYGLRMAVEEVMLQMPKEMPIAEVMLCTNEPSQTPAFEAHGVTLHSGDILVSRGGAPTSALISRGNDFPGSFSHVALLHVDPATRQATVIESHIECGVAVSSFDDYLNDKKLRIMVLRVRADLPSMKSDPMLPHKAAALALDNVRNRHIPYDFAMDCGDTQKQFCSEVVSVAYSQQGIHLWTEPTLISSPVVTAWLASVGVRHFETQEPAELEYDPQVTIVAEWRDRTTLLKAHIDDAVTDVMLDSARPGERLPYDLKLLPLARLSKGYSIVRNWLGGVGPIPEGMSATEALRVKRYRHEHDALTSRVVNAAEEFKSKRGHTPFYWELVQLARAAK